MRATLDRPGLRAAALIALVSALRLWIAAGVGLGDDEAYYWLWAQRLDWSYFDHPPMVAWLIAGSTAIFGDSPAAVRLPFALLGGLLPLQAAGLARSVGRPPGLTASLVLWAPMFTLLSVFACPDMPLLCTSAACLQAAVWARGGDAAGRWALVGALWGLALLCKLPALLLGPLLLLEARRAGVGGLVALSSAFLAASAPVWLWSFAHDHAMLRFHLVGRHVQPLGAWGGLAAFVGGVALLSGGTLAGLRRAGAERRPIDLLGMAYLAAFTLSATRTRALPHWAAPGLLLLAPAAASALALRPRLRRTLLAVGAALGSLVLVQARWAPFPLPWAADPTVEQRGWPQVARRLQAELQASPPGTFVATTRYQLAAQVAWALGPELPLRRLGGRPDQLDLWRDDGPLEGQSAVLLCNDQYRCKPEPARWAAGCAPLPDEVVRDAAGAPVRRFSLWRCGGFIAEDPG
jgi:4-amino-4-deoxy-L-arabinose transferase-like glycosyltransferase